MCFYVHQTTLIGAWAWNRRNDYHECRECRYSLHKVSGLVRRHTQFVKHYCCWIRKRETSSPSMLALKLLLFWYSVFDFIQSALTLCANKRLTCLGSILLHFKCMLLCHENDKMKTPVLFNWQRFGKLHESSYATAEPQKDFKVTCEQNADSQQTIHSYRQINSTRRFSIDFHQDEWLRTLINDKSTIGFPFYVEIIGQAVLLFSKTLTRKKLQLLLTYYVHILESINVNWISVSDW